MEPRIVERAAFTVVGLMYRGRNESGEIPELWHLFVARMHEIASVSPATYGVMGNIDPTSGDLSYVAGLQADPAAPVPAGMVSWEIPAGPYAAFPCTLNTIAPTFSLIYDTWLPNSGYERTDGPEFEYYGTEYEHDNNDSTMYIYIPVSKLGAQ